MKRLKLYRDPASKRHIIPHDLNRHFCREVFQSSSCKEFNTLFENLLQKETHERLLNGVVSTPLPSVEDLATMASNYYNELSQLDNVWTGLHSAGKSAFTLSQSKSKRACFNCGDENHITKDCTKPFNATRVEARRQEYFRRLDEAKKDGRTYNNNQGGRGSPGGRGRGGRGGRGNNRNNTESKWKPPTDEEKKNKNQRIIDNVLYWYHFKSKRWNKVRDQPKDLQAKHAKALLAKIDDSAKPSTTEATPERTVHFAAPQPVPVPAPSSQVAPDTTPTAATAPALHNVQSAKADLLQANIQRAIAYSLPT